MNDEAAAWSHCSVALQLELELPPPQNFMHTLLRLGIRWVQRFAPFPIEPWRECISYAELLR